MDNTLFKKTAKVRCSEIMISEFPQMLFGTYNKRKVFDASFYLTSKNLTEQHFLNFLKVFDFQIKVILHFYNIKEEDAFILNEEKHVLVDGSLCYQFISYCDPNFLPWVYQRIEELMKTGITVSDTFVLQQTMARFSREFIDKVFNGPAESEEGTFQSGKE